MKTDDDMYINLPKLYELVRANKKPNLLLGSLICNAVPIKARSHQCVGAEKIISGSGSGSDFSDKSGSGSGSISGSGSKSNF